MTWLGRHGLRECKKLLKDNIKFKEVMMLNIQMTSIFVINIATMSDDEVLWFPAVLVKLFVH